MTGVFWKKCKKQISLYFVSTIGLLIKIYITKYCSNKNITNVFQTNSHKYSRPVTIDLKGEIVNI